MGYECYYSGVLPDTALQEKVIKFAQSFYSGPPDLIVTPYPHIKYDTKISYIRKIGEAIPGCCNEKVWREWNGYASCEQHLSDYPCDYYGIIHGCDRTNGFIYYGEFVFDRTAGGRLVSFDNWPDVYLDHQAENDGEVGGRNGDLTVRLNLTNTVRGNTAYPLLLSIIKLRWWPDLVCSDDEDFCQEYTQEIWKYGLAKKLMDENLDFDECLKLYRKEHEKYFPPPPPEKPESEEINSPKLIEVPDGIMEWPIAELNLSVRSSTCMQRMNIKTIGDLMQKSEDEILKQKNTGRKCVAQINEALGEYGLSLKKNPE